MAPSAHQELVAASSLGTTDAQVVRRAVAEAAVSPMSQCISEPSRRHSQCSRRRVAGGGGVNSSRTLLAAERQRDVRCQTLLSLLIAPFRALLARFRSRIVVTLAVTNTSRCVRGILAANTHTKMRPVPH